jgi:hypothetical protein
MQEKMSFRMAEELGDSQHTEELEGCVQQHKILVTPIEVTLFSKRLAHLTHIQTQVEITSGEKTSNGN